MTTFAAEGGTMSKHGWARRLGLVAVAGVVMALAPAFAAPATAAPGNKVGSCPTNGTWTLVDFVYSGNYKATGLYEYGWVTYPALGAANQEFFGGVSVRDAYFLAVDSVDDVDYNGDQMICISWLGANPGIDDVVVSIVDNHAGPKS